MDRPKLNNYDDDHDELLKLQAEFVASKIVPSIRVIKKSEKRKSAEPTRDVVHMDTLPPAPPSLDAQPPKKSRFRADRDGRQTPLAGQTTPAPRTSIRGPPLDPEEMINRQDRGLAAMISSIIERDTRNATFTMPQHSSQAFPSVIKNSSVIKGGSQRQSIFSQQVAERGVGDFGVVTQAEGSSTRACKSTAAFEPSSSAALQAAMKSSIVQGQGLSASQAEEEAQSIHKDNLAKLSQMSQDEILTEQQQLLTTLDPSMVEFLRSKSKSGTMPAEQSKAKAPGKSAEPPQQKQPTPSEDVTEVAVMEGRENWVHMDTVEHDKLEWMKDLPPPSADDVNTGQQARFDFQGRVIPTDADVPLHVGLHHHGQEPERAGYSIGELFQLARSTNVQQRVLALTTLGNIIQKAKEGMLEEFIQTPILPSITEAGVVFLLRWACDDSVDAVMTAAISALSALLCNSADEAAVDWVFPWFQGHSVPSLVPPATVELMENNKVEQDDDNKAQETDADVTKRDMIQGLMGRMMLQERLFYILESRQPQPLTVLNILSILTRVARHSTQMAYEISRNTKMMTLIFHNFLPTSWADQAGDRKAVSSVYGRPLAAAMRLVGCLCQAGRHIASSLVASYSVHNILMGYLSVRADVHFSDLLLSVKEAESLQKESLMTWRILLDYGLAADVFVNIYQPLMDQLKGVTSRLASLSCGQQTERDVLLLSALEGLLPVAAMFPLKPGFTQSEASHTESPVTSSVSWSHVESLCPLVSQCAEQCLTHLAQHYTQQKPSLQFPAVCLNFMATFYSKWESQSGQNAVDFVQQVEQFSVNSMTPFLKSWGFTSIAMRLCSSSNVLLSPSSAESKRREVVSCLPELGCDCCEGRVPVVGEGSPVGFLLALCRLLYCLCRVHKDLTQQTAAVILSHKDITSYLLKVTTCARNHLHSNHFTGMETLLQYFLMKLSTLVGNDVRPPMMHQLALDMMSRLQEGDEFLAQDLMTTVIFNADFIPEGKEEELTSASLADLKISGTHILKSATQGQISTDNCKLLSEGLRALPAIRAHYFIAFAAMEGRVARSRCRYQQLPQNTDSVMKGGWENCLMPRDWVFLPLVELFNRFASVHSLCQNLVECYNVPVVASTVQWIFMLEMWRGRALSHISVTLKVSRLMCIFLGGDQLFLEKSLYPYLASLFRIYTTPRQLNAMNFEENIPGISFYDLYMQLLGQFEGVSYGDRVFGSFVLLPMQQSHNCLLRRAVWQERSLMLRAMTLPIQEMLIDVERFLTPEETDPQLLQLYASCLVCGAVRQCWSPLFFLVALHHLNRFLFRSQSDDVHRDLRQALWDKVLRCNDKGLREAIVHFKQVNPQAPDCMETYPQLPAHRQQLLTSHRQRLALQ